MEVIYQIGPTKVSFVKGALETVLVRCDSYLHHGKIIPLDGSGVPADSVRYCAELGGRGLRVLALARGNNGTGKLTYLGLVAMQDPPRYGVTTSVRTLGESGVRTVMLTGDAKETALAIADQVGLFGPDQSRPARSGSVSGEDLDRMEDADLTTVVRSVQVRVATKIFKDFGGALNKAFIIGWETVSIVHYTRPGTCINRTLH